MDTQTRFVMANIDGEQLYVGWPQFGNGVFGDWSLARGTIAHSTFARLEFVRAMTPVEIDRLYRAPFIRWGVLITPSWPGAERKAWALQLCRPAVASSQAQSVRTRTIAGDRRVGV